MSNVEAYNNAKRALSRAHEMLERIADERKQALDKVRQRSDLDGETRIKLSEAVNRATDTKYREARKEVEKSLEAARAAVRKGRRRDEWDAATEMRVAGASGRLRHFLEDPETDIGVVVKQFTDEAVADGDLATVIALRRELPILARRRGLPAKAIERELERLDLLTDDREIGLSVANGRELTSLERNVANMLSSFDHEIAGKSEANVFLRADGEKVFRNGYQQGPDGTVIAPRPSSIEETDAVARLEQEYRNMFGPGSSSASS